MTFLIRTVISALLIASVSMLAGKRPALAGFIIALPLTSMLAILFSYVQYKDMAKINQFAESILVAVPLSLVFFVPFLLNKWLKLNFIPTYFLALACLTAAYFLHQLIFKSQFFR